MHATVGYPTQAPAPPTELTRGLLNALDRPALPSITPTAGGTLLAGLLSAGVYPAFALPRKWRKNLRWHQSTFWHLSEWAMVNVGVEEGRRLHRDTRARLPLALANMAILCSLVSLVTAAVGVSLGYRLVSFWHAGPIATLSDPVFTTFNSGLLGAFLFTWLSVNAHLRRLHQARDALQRTGQLPSTAGKPVARWEWGLRPGPVLIGGLLLILAGFWWALPMVIAATAQRRALLAHNRGIRRQMAQRVRELLDRRRPLEQLPPVIDRVGVCRNAVCDATLPPDALFCPRCGMPQRPISAALA